MRAPPAAPPAGRAGTSSPCVTLSVSSACQPRRPELGAAIGAQRRPGIAAPSSSAGQAALDRGVLLLADVGGERGRHGVVRLAVELKRHKGFALGEDQYRTRL